MAGMAMHLSLGFSVRQPAHAKTKYYAKAAMNKILLSSGPFPQVSQVFLFIFSSPLIIAPKNVFITQQ